MKVQVQAQLEFLLPLTQQEVSILMRVSAKHYDAVCRQASQEQGEENDLENGFITSWRNILKFHEMYPNDDPNFVPRVSATWRQIDTCCKILERINLSILRDPIERAEAERLGFDLGQVLRMASPLFGKWNAEINIE